MDTLYILGNGFDIAHELPTRYWDFRQFLVRKNWEFLERFEELYGVYPIDRNDPYTNVKVWEDCIKQRLWGALEEKMAQLDIESLLDISDSIVEQMDLDGGNWGIEDTMNEYWKKEFSFISLLPQYVYEWIESIDLSDVTPMSSRLLRRNGAKFLTLNYTATLEECYQVDPDDILHIHGALKKYSEYGPILGHGYKKGVEKHRQKADEADYYFDEGRKSIENAIVNIFSNTIKDTDSLIREHRGYFETLDSIDEVVILGLSYSDVDIPYLLEVKRYVKSEAKWTLYYHSLKDHEKLNEIIKRLEIDQSLVKYLHSDVFWK